MILQRSHALIGVESLGFTLAPLAPSLGLQRSHALIGVERAFV